MMTSNSHLIIKSLVALVFSTAMISCAAGSSDDCGATEKYEAKVETKKSISFTEGNKNIVITDIERKSTSFYAHCAIYNNDTYSKRTVSVYFTNENPNSLSELYTNESKTVSLGTEQESNSYSFSQDGFDVVLTNIHAEGIVITADCTISNVESGASRSLKVYLKITSPSQLSDLYLDAETTDPLFAAIVFGNPTTEGYTEA